MKKKNKPPCIYGLYLVEYREKPGGLLRFLKEKINTFEEAQAAREKLIQAGYHDPIIRKIG
jgi:hypothetical protein